MNACTWAIVPIRSFASGKRRLASVLNPDQRAHLCVAMALRVVRTLRAHPGLADVAVVSPDAAVRAWSAQHASVVLDETGHGLNAALDHAARALQRLGASSLLIIPADVPALTTADVSALLDASEDVVIAPAARDGGTNALRLSLPPRLAFQFGAESAAVHLAAARSAGASVNLLPLRSLARDIDVIEDLVELSSELTAICGPRTLKPQPVIPAKAGIQSLRTHGGRGLRAKQDSRLRGNDGVV